MAKVDYVECSACRKKYYLDLILSKALISNPAQKLKCPYCRKEFYLEMKQEKNKDACS